MWWLVLVLAVSDSEAGRKKKEGTRIDEAAVAHVDLPCRWAPGSVWTYAYTHEEVETGAADPVVTRTSSAVRIEVQRSDDQGTWLAYTNSGYTGTGPADHMKFMEAVQRAGPLSALVVVLDPAGRPTGIGNLDEAVDQMMPILREGMPDAPEEAFAATEAMFRDPVTGPAWMLKEPGKLLALHCASMAPGEVRGGPAPYPNPFGGEPISSMSSVQLVEVQPKERTATFRTEDRVSADALEAVLRQGVARMGVAITEERLAEVLAEARNMRVGQSGTMVYRLDDGFPVSVAVTVEAVGPTSGKTESWSWTLQPPGR